LGRAQENLGLGEYRAIYAGEASSLEAAPLLGAAPVFEPGASSPVLSTGDASLHPDAQTVSIGHRPLAHQR